MLSGLDSVSPPRACHCPRAARALLLMRLTLKMGPSAMPPDVLQRRCVTRVGAGLEPRTAAYLVLTLG